MTTIRAGTALLAMLFHAYALAQPPPAADDGDTVWHCWYNHDTTFRCRLAQAPEERTDARRPATTGPQSRSSLYPRRGPLPPIVKTLHENPRSLMGRTITVPLFSPPIDMAFAATLVESVMCGARPMCRTLIFRSFSSLTETYEEDPGRE